MGLKSMVSATSRISGYISLPTAPLPRGSSSSMVRASDKYSGSRFNLQLGPVLSISLISLKAY